MSQPLFRRKSWSTRPSVHTGIAEFLLVTRTVRYLNEDLPANASFDLTPLLEKELEEKAAGLRQDFRVRVLRSVIFLFTLVLIILFLLDMTGVFQITVFFGA